MSRAWLPGSSMRLLRVAALAALIGLAVMCASLIWPRALPVILAMSVGHAIGALAVGCYVLVVVMDARQREPPADTPPE